MDATQKQEISALRRALITIASGRRVTDAEEIHAIREMLIVSVEHARAMLNAGVGL